MAIITTGQTFNPTGVVTSTKLEDIANKATFVAGAVDGTSLELISSGDDDGKLGIKDAGITTDKVADSTDKTDGVTFPKIQHISTDKVLGRQTASDGNVEEVDVVIGGTGDAGVLFDNDDMLDNSDTAGGSATRGATQQSIKAYVDTTRSFSKPDFLGSFAQIPATDTNITVTHNLGTTDLIYFIQMKLPTGEITQMNPALTYPEYDAMKPTGLSVFITTNTFSCRSGRGWAFWRTQADAQTGNSRSQLDYNDSRTNYQFRIIAYKLS